MTNESFKELINNYEGLKIDYKVSSYNFQESKEIADAKFIKDLICFANTVRDSSAFIIFGVKEEDDGTKVLNGIEHFPDDAVFQQKTKSKVFPIPIFSAYKFNYEGKLFGIIEIPIHPYKEPLVAAQKLKGLQVDKIYIRQGSSNEEATHTQTVELLTWLEEINANTTRSNEEGEIDALITEFSDTSNKLSSLFAKCFRLRRVIKNTQFIDFVTRELHGFNGVDNTHEKSDYRFILAPVTPYKIEVKSYAGKNANQMIEYFFSHEKFRKVNYRFSKSIFEIETIIDNLKQQPKLLTLSHLNKEVFPGVETDIENATIFFGPEMIDNLYLKIRLKAIEWLTEITTSADKSFS